MVPGMSSTKPFHQPEGIIGYKRGAVKSFDFDNFRLTFSICKSDAGIGF